MAATVNDPQRTTARNARRSRSSIRISLTYFDMANDRWTFCRWRMKISPCTVAASPPPRLALVGDRSPSVRAHDKIPLLLRALAAGSEEAIEPYWLHSTDHNDPADVAGFDGIWVAPGKPLRQHPAGVLIADHRRPYREASPS